MNIAKTGNIKLNNKAACQPVTLPKSIADMGTIRLELNAAPIPMVNT